VRECGSAGVRECGSAGVRECGSAGVRLRGMVSRRRRGHAAREGSGAELATFLLGGNAAEGKVGWHWWCGDRGGDARLRWVAWQRRWRVDRGVHLRPKAETGRVCGLPAGAESCGCAGLLVGGGGGPVGVAARDRSGVLVGGGPVGVAARDRSGVLVGGGPVGVAARDRSGVLGGADGVSSESATCGCSGGCGAERWRRVKRRLAAQVGLQSRVGDLSAEVCTPRWKRGRRGRPVARRLRATAQVGSRSRRSGPKRTRRSGPPARAGRSEPEIRPR
jgi:hypothetical protein